MKRSFVSTLAILGLFMVPALCWSQPVIEFENSNYDFGTAYPNQDLVHTFVFLNKGSEELVIDSVSTSCGCTAAVMSATSIPASATGAISVTMSTAAPGKLHKTVTVTSNDPKNPRTMLDVIADVRNLWSWSPKPTFTFRDIPINSEAQEVLYLANTEGEPFEILGFKVSRPEFVVEKGEMTEKGVPITVTLKAGPTKEFIPETLEIRTNNPNQPVIRIQISAEVTGYIKFNMKRVYFGSVPAGKTVSKTIIATCAAEAGKPFEISKVEADSELVQSKILESKDNTITLELTFTAPDRPGYHNGEIQIHTNVESEPVTLLPYSALVRK